MTGSGGQVSWYPLPTLNKKRTESRAPFWATGDRRHVRLGENGTIGTSACGRCAPFLLYRLISKTYCQSRRCYFGLRRQNPLASLAVYTGECPSPSRGGSGPAGRASFPRKRLAPLRFTVNRGTPSHFKNHPGPPSRFWWLWPELVLHANPPQCSRTVAW